MKEIERKVYKYLKDRNWHNPIPADLAKSIMIEGAELLEHFQWENLTIDELKKNKEKLEEIKGEIADVLIYTIQLSVLLGFDTEKVIKNKLIKTSKKYPVDVFSSKKGYFDTQKKYLEIKKNYRSKKNK